MSNLVRAGLERLKKDKIFWCLIGLAALGAAILCYSQYQDLQRYRLWAEMMPENESYVWGLQDASNLRTLLFKWASVIGLSVAVLAGVFCGTDYSDGTIRNKIIAGHRRRNIYLSGFWLCLAGGLFFAIAFMGTVLLLGLPLFGWQGETTETVLFLLDGILVTAAYAALCNLISMLIPRRTYGLIVNLFVVGVLMIAGMVVLMRLAEPEFTNYATEIFVNGEPVLNHMSNPLYLSGDARKVFQLLLDILPSGQGYQIAGLSVWRPEWLWLFSAVFAGAANGVGCRIFAKKDLK